MKLDYRQELYHADLVKVEHFQINRKVEILYEEAVKEAQQNHLSVAIGLYREILKLQPENTFCREKYAASLREYYEKKRKEFLEKRKAPKPKEDEFALETLRKLLVELQGLTWLFEHEERDLQDITNQLGNRNKRK